LFWPAKKGIEFLPHVPSDGTTPGTGPKAAGYIQSVAALQTVRERLIATDQLDEEQQESINALTLALMAGSDQ
jgi:hypothetical protein